MKVLATRWLVSWKPVRSSSVPFPQPQGSWNNGLSLLICEARCIVVTWWTVRTWGFFLYSSMPLAVPFHLFLRWMFSSHPCKKNTTATWEVFQDSHGHQTRLDHSNNCWARTTWTQCWRVSQWLVEMARLGTSHSCFDACVGTCIYVKRQIV